MEIRIGRIILDATVRSDAYSENQEKLILLEAIFSNLWDHRIPTYGNKPLLIDSEGFQHAAYDLGFEATIVRAKYVESGMEISRIANEIEGKAKSLGWIAFPRLKKPIVPHRLIFQFHVFDPGYTSGSVRHAETLELIFNLSLFSRLLNDGNSLNDS
jgi:hypothetical protein